MPRYLLALALLLGVSAMAAESSAPPVAQSVRESIPAAKPAVEVDRKAGARKAGEAPKGPRDTPKPPLPPLEEKNLGLGCAQG